MISWSFRHCIAGRVFKRDQGERSVWRLSWRCRIAWVRWVWRWDDLNGQVRTHALRLQNCWQLWADEQAILQQKCWSLVCACKILKSRTKSSAFSYTVKGWKGGKEVLFKIEWSDLGDGIWVRSTRSAAASSTRSKPQTLKGAKASTWKRRGMKHLAAWHGSIAF